MMRGSHARDDNSFTRSASTQTAKAIGLLAVAAIIGIVLLRTAPHPTTVTSGGLSPATTKAPSPTIPESTTTPTTSAPRSPSAVHVLVANGAGVANLGARIRGQLSAAGYNTDKLAIDAPTQDHAVSSIYFQPGFEAEALQLATVLSLAPSVVSPLPTAAPPVPADKLVGVDVLVIAGQDIAGVQTTSPPGETVAPTPRTTVVHHTSTTVEHSTTTALSHSTTTTSHSTTTR